MHVPVDADLQKHDKRVAIKLQTYLRRASGIPFQWGTHDCYLFICSWAKELCGADPAAGFRGSYDCWEEASDLCRANGLLRTTNERLRLCGFRRVYGKARLGDIGYIRTHAGMTGAIRGNYGRWTFLSDGGVASQRGLTTVRCWRYVGDL